MLLYFLLWLLISLDLLPDGNYYNGLYHSSVTALKLLKELAMYVQSKLTRMRELITSEYSNKKSGLLRSLSKKILTLFLDVYKYPSFLSSVQTFCFARMLYLRHNSNITIEIVRDLEDVVAEMLLRPLSKAILEMIKILTFTGFVLKIFIDFTFNR